MSAAPSSVTNAQVYEHKLALQQRRSLIKAANRHRQLANLSNISRRSEFDDPARHDSQHTDRKYSKLLSPTYQHNPNLYLSRMSVWLPQQQPEQ